MRAIVVVVLGVLLLAADNERTIQGPIYVFDMHHCAYDMPKDQTTILIACWDLKEVDGAITIKATPGPADAR